MAKDTKRDRVWRAVLELGRDPPTYRVEQMFGGAEIHGFSKADVRLHVDGDSSSRTVHDVIQTALEYGILQKVKEPPHASVHSHPETGNKVQMEIYGLAGGGETRENHTDTSRNASGGGEGGVRSEHTSVRSEANPDPLREAVEAVDLEGGGAVVEARREALVDVLAYLREEGSATAAELKGVIDDEDDRLYADADSFWTNMRRQNVFDELDVVGKPGKGGKRYYWE